MVASQRWKVPSRQNDKGTKLQRLERQAGGLWGRNQNLREEVGDEAGGEYAKYSKPLVSLDFQGRVAQNPSAPFCPTWPLPRAHTPCPWPAWVQP